MVSIQSRKYFNLMLHFFSWLLFAFVLLFYQPLSGSIEFPAAFWIKQCAVLFFMVIVFYLNSYVLVPKLLLKNKTFAFTICLVSIVIVVPQLIRSIENLLGLPELMSKTFAKQGIQRPPRKKDLIDGFMLMMALLILGISTSVTLIQKWQVDKMEREKLEKDKIGSELSFLKAQINPHFFFNTLNNIYALTHVNIEDSRSALHKLSRMMRYLLYETKLGSTPVSKEVSFIVDFIALMKLRLNEFTIVNFTSPKLERDFMIAPMLFLPFVENAFKYGISTTEVSKIDIAINIDGNLLTLQIKNDILNYNTEKTNEYGGIGLTNTKRRLELLYAGKYELNAGPNAEEREFIVNLKLLIDDSEMHSGR